MLSIPVTQYDLSIPCHPCALIKRPINCVLVEKLHGQSHFYPIKTKQKGGSFRLFNCINCSCKIKVVNKNCRLIAGLLFWVDLLEKSSLEHS